MLLTQSFSWSCSQGGDSGFHHLKACLGLRSSSKLTHMISGGVLSSSTCGSLHRDARVLTTWYLTCLGRGSDKRERDRETHPEGQTDRKREIYYKTVSWVNHQPFHHSLWEGNESLSSTRAQEEQIKCVCVCVCVCVCACVCVCRERERRLSTGEGQVCLTSFIQSVPTIFLSLIFCCTWANPASIQALEIQSSVSVIAFQSRSLELFFAWRSLLNL